MATVSHTKQVVLKYFHSWQEPADFDGMKSCLADDVVFDAGILKIIGAENLCNEVKKTAPPWKDVELLKSLFLESQAVLFYEGTDKNSGIKTRVAEFLELKGGKISAATVVFVPLNPPDGQRLS